VTLPRPIFGISVNAMRRRSRGALERLLAIAPMLELARGRNADRKYVLRLTDGALVSSMVQLAEHIAQQQGISARTAQRWYSHFRDAGYTRLAHTRADRGKARYFVKHAAIAEFVRQKYLAEKIPARGIYLALRRELQDQAPCETTVRHFLKSLAMPARKRRARGQN